MRCGAIKKFGYQTLNKDSGSDSELAEVMNMHKNYTYITASSYKTMEYYKEAFNADKDKMKLIGMPRIDYILEENADKIDKIYETYPRLREKPNVLYVPTFRKDKLNDMEELQESFDFERYNLVIKYHQLDKTRRKTNNFIEEKAIIVNDKYSQIYDLYKICDYLITDYSSAAIEACILDKPIYFYVYDIDEYIKDPGLNINPLQEMPEISSKEFSTIMKWIKEGSYDYDAIRDFKNKYINIDLNENCTKQLLDFILTGEVHETIYEEAKKHSPGIV